MDSPRLFRKGRMDDKENTILSKLYLTATTGIAKTMKVMREQKRQSSVSTAAVKPRE